VAEIKKLVDKELGYIVEGSLTSHSKVCYDQGSYRPWKVLEFFCSEFQAWKVLEKGIGPGKPWKFPESPGILKQRFWIF